MYGRSIATLLVLCLAAGCSRLIGADFDRTGALDGGGGDDAGDATMPQPPPLDGGDGPGDVADGGDDGGDDGPTSPAMDAGDAGDTGDAGVGDAIDDGANERGDAPDDGDGADAGRADDAADASDDGLGVSDASDGGAGDAGDHGGEPNVPPTLYVAATTDDKGLWLFAVPIASVADVTSNLAPPLDVLAQGGAVRSVDDVEVQSVGKEVFVLGRVGTKAHITSMRGDTWTGWQPVATDVEAMALANVEGDLWACLVGGDGRLRLMSRDDGGTWQNRGDVMEAASIPGGEAPTALIKVDCAGMGDELEVLALDRVGRLWNATMIGDRWSPFRRVATATDSYTDVDACNAVGDLHVLLATTTKQWHASRAANEGWSGFADIEYFTGDPMGDIVAGAQASLLAEIEWLQLNSLGEIWIGTRFRCCPRPYQLLARSSPSGRPFASISATSVLPF